MNENKTRTRCKNGERKNKLGICEKKQPKTIAQKQSPITLSSDTVVPSFEPTNQELIISPIISPPKKTKRSRCKKGERKNKQGVCEKKNTTEKLPSKLPSLSPLQPLSISPQLPNQNSTPPSMTIDISQILKPKRSRCKKGERKNKQGVCEKKNTTAKLPSKSALLSSLSSLLPLPTSLDQNLLPPTPIEPTPIQITGKPKRSRCKKGERKNKQGVCEKKNSTSVAKAPSKFPTPKSASLKAQSLNTTISYRPSINKQLVSIRSASDLHTIQHCNHIENNNIDFPLKININGECISVKTNEAKQYLLKELKKNKHLNVEKIILPKQYDSNCWFNTFFTCMFISDKGRQFSLYFRQLMIEGKLSNNDAIPKKLINVFSLLNYFIHCCLAGDNFALNELNTNTIINYIYKHIPKHTYRWIVPRNEPGNPIAFYSQLISYLNINSIILKMYGSLESIKFDYTNIPDIMILTYRVNNYNTNKKTTLTFGNYKYELDSACVLDNSNRHFCALIYCNKQEYSYDGETIGRLEKMPWTHLLNRNETFTFVYNDDVIPVYFNFLIGYSMLIYYRKT